MQEIFLNDLFRRKWEGKDPFEEAFQLDGESFRKVKSRHTFRFELEGRGYFVKLHEGTGWAEILKNWLQFKAPVLGACNEYHALRHLRELGVDTMTPCAYGYQGTNPAEMRSFLITEELTGVISLEDYCRNWPENPPPFSGKYALIRKLASMTAAMHRGGLNHRDCYLCHFLLKQETEHSEDPVLYVIDLHRAQIRNRIPYRYRVKDLAGLFFSAMDTGITRNDLFRFLKTYTGMSLRDAFRRHGSLISDANHAARKLYRKEFRKDPPEPGGTKCSRRF